MPVDPPTVPDPPKGLVIKDSNNKNILVVKDISKEGFLFRLLVWAIIKLMC